MPDLTQQFADYLFSKKSKITDPVLRKAEACLKDYMSVTKAGAAKNRKRWEALLRGRESGNAALIGYDEKTDSKTAALINGFNAHTLELDDGQRFAMIHLGASVISAVNAAKADYPVSERDVLTGIVMGYEAACRIALAMQPSHKNLGYHTAGTCGTVGSAVGAAFALSLDRTQMIRVISCAAGSSAGMLEIQEQRSEIKPYNLGRAAMDGLAAAFMGMTDFEVPDDILGGERGFFRMFSESFDAGKLTEQTGYFEIERIYVKPYASCRHSHSAVEAAVALHSETGGADIKAITVRTYRLGVKGHDHTDIPGTASAKLSTPYAVAAGLLYGRADLTVFEPLDERITELAKKVRVIEDPELTAECPGKRIAVVQVELEDGKRLEKRVDYAKGEPENPLTEEETEEKRTLLEKYSEMFSSVI